MNGQTNLFAVRDLRRVGYFTVDNEIIDKYGARLGAYGVAIYAVLSRRCKNSTQQVSNLSQRDIAGTLGISRDRVGKSLQELVESGLIHVEAPDRPAPGAPGGISTITLLTVKPTQELVATRPGGGRHTTSKGHLLVATRPLYKEVKTKTKTKEEPKQHGFAEVSDFLSPESCNAETAKAISVWSGIKTQLEHLLPSAEFSQWVRPTYVQRVAGDCIILAAPPDGRIHEKLRASEDLQRLLREAGYSGAKFTPYSDDYELQKLAGRFPDAYASLPPALKKRAQATA
jgi:hypothetical protein